MPLSDEEFLGSGQAQSRGLSEEEFMTGASPKAAPRVSAPGLGMSDREFFGTEVDPAQGAYPGTTPGNPAVPPPDPNSRLGITGWAREGARAVAQGAVSTVGTYLQGKAGDTGRPVILPGESDLEYQLRLEEWKTKPSELPIQQNPLYQAGSTLNQLPILQRPKGLEDNLFLDVMSGGGSIGAMLATAPLGPGFSMDFATGMGRGEAVERAIRAGATEEQIRRAGDLGTFAGAGDLADFLMLQTGSAGKAMGLIRRIGSKALKGAFIEGGMEGAQQLIQNAIAQGVYKPDQDIWEEVGRNALVGAIVGGAAKPILDRSHKVDEQPPTKEQMDAVFGEEQPVGDGPAPQQAPTDVSSRLRLPPGAPAAATPEVQPPQAEGPVGDGPSPIERVFQGAPEEPQEAPRTPDSLGGWQGVERETPQGRPAVDILDAQGDLKATLVQDERGQWNFAFHSKDMWDRKVSDFSRFLPGASDAPRTPDQVSDEEAIALLRTWVGGPQGKRSMGTLTNATIDNQAATLPQWIELAKRQVFIDKAQATSPTAPQEGVTPNIPPPAPKNEIPSNIVDFIQARAAMQASRTRAPSSEPPTDPNAPMLEEREEGRERRVRRGTEEDATRPGSRASGTNPRALGTNERALGTNPRALRSDEDLQGVKEEFVEGQVLGEIEARPGADLERLAPVLGPQLYGDVSFLPNIAVKEMFQNSADAISGMLERGELQQGKIDIQVDEKARTVRVVDNGSGMDAEILGTKFLEIAGTEKNTLRPKGGFGIAKMAFLFGAKTIKVITMKNGRIHELNATGPQLFASMNDHSRRPKVQTRVPTAAEKALFKDGHGTAVQVTIPETWHKSSTGTDEKIHFPFSYNGVPALSKSPLFENTVVTFNGVALDNFRDEARPVLNRPGVGAHFPIGDYVPFANINFGWGTARIYTSKEAREFGKYDDNVHFLSNGLWQFSNTWRLNPLDLESPKINREFYIDISPKVRPEQGGYPFQLNRQGFTDVAAADITKIRNYVSALHRHAQIAASAEAFDHAFYIQVNPETGDFEQVYTKIEPDKPQTRTPLNFAEEGNEVSMVDGKIVVNGKVTPELTQEEMAKLDPTALATELIVEQSKFDPDRTMIHDNVLVEISDLEKKSVMQLGQEKFGRRFDNYLFGIGTHFRVLRDVVSDMTMPKKPTSKPRPPAPADPLEQVPFDVENEIKRDIDLATGDLRDYTGLKEWVTGISFDITYRGVNIKVPFSGVFINPAVPQFNDGPRAGVLMIGTMVHELAHFKHRNHGVQFRAEMEAIYAHLETHPTFDFPAFKQSMRDHVTTNQDIQTYINDVFTGLHTIQPRGKRFQDASTDEARDGGVAGSGAQAGLGREGAGAYAAGVAGGQGSSGTSPRRAKSGYRVTEKRVVTGTPERTNQLTNALREESGDPDIVSAPAMDDIIPLMEVVRKSGGGKGGKGAGGNQIPPGVAALPAHAAKIGWMLKYTHGAERLLDKNMHVSQYVKFVQFGRALRRKQGEIIDAAQRIAKDWRSLGVGKGGQMTALANLIEDVSHMRYRSPAEVAADVVRHPTRAEFDALVKKHKVGADALRVFGKQRDFMHYFLDQVRVGAIQRAERNLSNDPVKLAKRIDQINAKFIEIRNRPFFPFTRFGRHYILIRDKNNIPVFFQTYEGRGAQSARQVREMEAKKLRAKMQPGDELSMDELPDTMSPFVGLPDELLDGIESELGLTDTQRKQMALLRTYLSPASRFGHRYADRSYTPGYSDDLLRSFSLFSFHGARYLARTTYMAPMKDQIADLRLAGARSPKDLKLGALANYMQDNLEKTVMDTSGDFGLIKGWIFLWTFGYSVVGAVLNLTQIPIVSYNWLASNFGGIGIGERRSAWAISKALLDIRNFYRRGVYSDPSKVGAFKKVPWLAPGTFEAKAFDYAVKTQRITESQSSDLASLSQADNLLRLGKTKIGRVAHAGLEYGALFFETTEQMNRRVTFRAALTMARKFPNSNAEKEAVVRFSDEMADLIAGGMNPADARVLVTALHAVEQTQFVYAKENRPRLMRNRWAAIVLVFQNYMLQILQLMGNNKGSMLPRMVITYLLLSGLTGLPGAEEAEDLANAFGRHFYGNDFNARVWIREWMHSMGAGDLSDLVLHGLARHGFGVPALLDTIGENPGRGFGPGPGRNVPAPQIDMSKSVGMGQILPFDVGAFINPDKKADTIIAEQGQRTSGAAFSVGFNLFKTLADIYRGADPGDLKTWERTMPRAASGASRGWRAYSEGRERGKGGIHSAPTIVPYDVRDTEQMGEVIALVLGFMPLRHSATWDLIKADTEAKMKLQLDREIIMKQRFEAIKGGSEEELQRTMDAIIHHNESLPEWAQGYRITKESHDASIKGMERERVAKESGVPVQRRQRSISEHHRQLFPNAVDVRELK